MEADVAKPDSIAADLTGNQDIDGILWGYKWGVTHLTYSFPTASSAYDGYETVSDFQAFNNTQTSVVGRILYEISTFTNLTFSATTNSNATLRFGRANTVEVDEDDGGALDGARAVAPDPGYLPNYSWGDVWVGADDHLNPVRGNFAYSTLLHEIGHALGLKHGQDGTHESHGTTFPELPYAHNSSEYSVMTYWQYVGDTQSQSTQQDLAQTYMQNDIAALQHLYGANYNYNSGNTIYRFDPQTGRMTINGYSDSVPDDNHIFRTIWDGGGNDTYEFSGYTTDMRIDLRPGEWSTLSQAQLADLGDGHTARGNVANAKLFQGNNASLIENANGGSGNDMIIGNDVGNRLLGGAGNDTLYGGLGADTMIGGNGDDTYSVDALLYKYIDANGGLLMMPGDTVTEVANGGNDTVYSSVNYGLTANVENLILTGYALNAAGNALNNRIYGNSEHNFIDGRGGADTMEGGYGSDTYIVDNEGDAVIEYQNGGVDLVKTNLVSHSLGENVENLTYTGSAYFKGYGNALANVIFGGNGSDLIDGRAGADTMKGGLGDDTYFVDSALDVIEDAGGNDTVIATASSYALQAGLETLVFRGAGHFSGRGNSLANSLAGGDGNDTLDGAGGSDTMAGGGGNDTYKVDGSGDAIKEKADGGIDAVLSSVTHTLQANVENLTLVGGRTAEPGKLTINGGPANGTGNELDNVITGNIGANFIRGLGGDDSLIGGAGNDRIDGGKGQDILAGDNAVPIREPIDRLTQTKDTATPSGSLGADTFMFRFGEAEGDVVLDFVGAGKQLWDVLEFSGYGEGMITRIGNTDYYLVTPDEDHGGAAAAEKIRIAGVLDLNTQDGSNDFYFV
jgi:serralysin